MRQKNISTTIVDILGRNNYGDFGGSRKVLTILILAPFQLKIKLRIQKDTIVQMRRRGLIEALLCPPIDTAELVMFVIYGREKSK
jgi:hypothetical protein